MTSTTEWPKRFREKVDVRGPDECWPWLGCSSRSYGMFWHQGRMHNSHRMAMILLGHEIPDGFVVMHRCDNRPCCNPHHLLIAEQVDNIADAHQKKRAPIGQTHGMHILTETQVREIRQRNETAAVAAAKYGVSRAAINDIRHRRSWRHI